MCPLSKRVWTTCTKTPFKFYTLLLTTALWKEAIAPTHRDIALYSMTFVEHVVRVTHVSVAVVA
jgi:hypothetical protein